MFSRISFAALRRLYAHTHTNTHTRPFCDFDMVESILCGCEKLFSRISLAALRRLYARAHTHAHIHTHTHTHTHTHKHTHTHTHAYRHAHTHTHLNSHSHSHSHAQQHYPGVTHFRVAAPVPPAILHGAVVCLVRGYRRHLVRGCLHVPAVRYMCLGRVSISWVWMASCLWLS